MGKISALEQTAGENFPEKAKKHPKTPEKRVLVEIIISPFPNYSSSLISFGNALQVTCVIQNPAIQGEAACLGQLSLPRQPVASLSRLSATRRPGGLPAPAQPDHTASGQPEQAKRHQGASGLPGQLSLPRRPA